MHPLFIILEMGVGGGYFWSLLNGCRITKAIVQQWKVKIVYTRRLL